VAQVYFRHLNSAQPQPKLALCGFTRIHPAQGQGARIAMDIPMDRFRYWDTTKRQYIVEPGDYELLVGAASCARRSVTTTHHTTALLPQYEHAGNGQCRRLSVWRNHCNARELICIPPPFF
jgi:hypothetical protein